MSLIEQAIAAVYRDDVHTLKDIVSRGLDINSGDKDGRTLLMHACLSAEPSLNTVKFLLENGADPDIHDANQQWTALHFAARDAKLSVAQILLEHGAKVDAVDSFGNTPLWRSVMNQQPNLETVEALLDSGADPTRKNNHGVSAIDIAQKLGKLELVTMLKARREK